MQAIPDKAITPPPECTGCALCANVCAHDAINMVWSEDGFLVPEVDATRCMNCGACVKACPAQPEHLGKLRAETDNTPEPPEAYGGWNTENETHLVSSSGGIFTALAQHTFNAGGCVFGVVWSSKDTAEFTKAENMAELAAMRGSKYTQAMPGTVYRQVKAELKKGRQVLFCGTSCQVYALRRYLRKEYDNLLLVDILCHGVPSRHLLQSYIQHYELTEGKEISEITFRHKDGDWENYKVQKRFKDASSVSHPNGEDMFIRLFVGDIVLNKACYNCPHARLPRVGDITLGDFWGVTETGHADWPIKDGISSVLSNTSKGESLLRKLNQQNELILQPTCFAQLYKGQPFTYIRKGEELPQDRENALLQLSRKRIFPLYKRLYLVEKCGPFRLSKGSSLHKIYERLRDIKRRLFARIPRSR